MGGEYFMPFSKDELQPQAEKLEIQNKKRELHLGIPKETHFQEKRICLTPDAVEVLVANGQKVLIESGAGESAHFSDTEYSDAGAQIVYSKKEVFEQPIVLKIEPPDQEELEMMKPGTYLLSAVQPSTLNPEYFSSLAKKKITAIGFEYFEDAHGSLPIVRLISEIAGTASVLVAAELLSISQGGNGLLLGGIAGVRPTEVVILGGGTVGENAARAALGLGASIKIFDASLSRLRRLQNDLGQRVPTSILDPKEILKALRRCDVAIGAIRGTSRTPIVVNEEMVKKMKPGAIIIDVSIDGGGCFESSEITTHENPTQIKHGVLHYGVTNITSRYARTSSKALSNFFLPYLLQVADGGGFDRLIRNDIGLRKGIYLYKGKHCNRELARWFDLDFKDINLFII